MGNNRLIVESKNDKIFLQAVINHLNLSSINFDAPICQVDDYDCLEGLNVTKLTNALDTLKNDLLQHEINSVGIILDNNGKQEKRFEQINQAISTVFNTTQQISKVGSFITVPIKFDDEIIPLKIGSFLIGVDDKGELETLLKAIATEEAPHADCLEAWQTCVHQKLGKNAINQKDFDKFWVNNYIRYDTCSKKERKQAERKCSLQGFEYIMANKSHIWNLDHSALDDLKAFLKSFQ